MRCRSARPDSRSWSRSTSLDRRSGTACAIARQKRPAASGMVVMIYLIACRKPQSLPGNDPVRRDIGFTSHPL